MAITAFPQSFGESRRHGGGRPVEVDGLPGGGWRRQDASGCRVASCDHTEVAVATRSFLRFRWEMSLFVFSFLDLVALLAT